MRPGGPPIISIFWGWFPRLAATFPKEPLWPPKSLHFTSLINRGILICTIVSLVPMGKKKSYFPWRNPIKWPPEINVLERSGCVKAKVCCVQGFFHPHPFSLFLTQTAVSSVKSIWYTGFWLSDRWFESISRHLQLERGCSQPALGEGATWAFNGHQSRKIYSWISTLV